MSEFFEFAREMIKIFIDGFYQIILGIWYGLKEIFGIKQYVAVFQEYSPSFNFGAWLLAGLLVLLMVALIGGIVYLIIFLIISRYPVSYLFIK